MAGWVMVIRGFDTDETGVLDAEQRIRQALPEHDLRVLTAEEWLYDRTQRPLPLPPLGHVAVHVPEHSAPIRIRPSHGSATRPQ